jgi:hypothetical protein
MGKELATFDYSAVPAEAKGKLIRLAGQIKKASGEHVAKILEIGQAVAEAHELLAEDGRDGAFAPWVERECGFTSRTAYNYMRVFQRFCPSNTETISHFSPTALYALTAPETPEAATKEAIKQADKGHRLDLEQAKAIIEKFREKKPAKSVSTKPAESKAENAETNGKDSEEPRRPSGGATFDPSEWETPASELLDGLKQPVPKEFVSIFRQAEEFDVQRRRLRN